MKYSNYLRAVPVFLFCLFILNCVQQKNAASSAQWPEILNPAYIPYMQAGERGFEIQFELSDPTQIPEAVVFNHIRQQISPADHQGKSFKFNLIAQSEVIEGFRPQPSKLVDGILFRKNDTLYLIPVRFKKMQN